MKYFILTYTTVSDYVERRTEFREIHLGLAKKFQESGSLIMGGALNPADQAVIIFRCESKDVVEDFVSQDPYVKNGLILSWDIKEWTVVVGGE